MKRMQTGLLFLAIAGAFLVNTQAAHADMYSGAWAPNSDDYFALDLNFTPGTGSLYMYDFGDLGDDLFVIADGIVSTTTISFRHTGVDWFAKNEATGLEINLGATQEFGFYFESPNGKFLSYDVTELAPFTQDNFLLYSPDVVMTVAVHDVSAVPEPTTLSLLALGGLALLRRRR